MSPPPETTRAIGACFCLSQQAIGCGWAASGLDPRYRQREWLLQIRRWPPGPVQALDQFLALS